MARLYGLAGLAEMIRFCLVQLSVSVLSGAVVVLSPETGNGAFFAASLLLAFFIFYGQYLTYRILAQTMMSMNIAFPQKLAPYLSLKFMASVAVCVAVLILAAGSVMGADVWQAGVSSSVALALVLGSCAMCMTTVVLRNALSARRWREPIVRTWETLLQRQAMGPSNPDLESLQRFVMQERHGMEGGAAMALCPPGAPRAAALRPGTCGFADIRGYFYPGLASQPIHDPEAFPFTRRLAERFDVIKAEVTALYTQSRNAMAPYPFAENEGWRSIPLFKGGTSVPRYTDQVPTLAAIIRNEIPGAVIRDAVISCLVPNGHIEPHFDNVIPMLTLHLPIIIPPGGMSGIRVGNEIAIYQEGAPIIIDTTYEHEAWNYGDHDRVIVLLDFWHPGVSPPLMAFFEEAYAIQMKRHLPAGAVPGPAADCAALSTSSGLPSHD
ncbi:aspartyl/asparaginyl beta-hydroxylase domain-containing protein (plasmid) [Azospirillum argentinense]|uniref:Aspartyl/asparaginyl beta-hydroxylase domain-containing protein n=1 Tax=Azospirillum argentinense TaxID=2970906 RepID=A0A4D8PNC4_9PROT|nr:aspartyl/asparaginyl beta-hydroxylase domain-containing protein [Azospirillum argentinense]QCO00024.1 aspartyl/asparaginyl beta-hydroxylase domain-containing protein [Azospirillum argentinense]QCO00283.1 aspartyl/asparaginyl beta-hydroxylase domain-containing protein [Azospirillum argentinense]